MTQKARRFVKDKLAIDETHELFREYDPETSLLNGLKDNKTLKQNATYQTTELMEDPRLGKLNSMQVRGCTVYDDIMQYNQMAPGSWYGGRVLPPFEIYMNLRRVYLGQEYLERPKSSIDAEESEEKY